MKPLVLIAISQHYLNICPDLPGKIEALGAEVVVCPETGAPMPRFSEAIERATACVTGVTPVTAEMMARAKNLRLILAFGAGFNHIDVEEASRRGILVTNAKGGNAQSAAELAMLHILAAARGIAASDESIRRGGWEARIGIELRGKLLGIVGTGAIGAIVGRIAHHGFGMKILAYDPYPNDAFAREVQAEYMPLDALLERADFVTLHTPLMAETRNMIGAAQLERMRPDAFLINVARGGLVDFEALQDAVEGGRIAGACLDVYPQEPYLEGDRIRGKERMVFTAHMGGLTRDAVLRLGEITVENVAALLKEGKPRLNVVNPEAHSA